MSTIREQAGTLAALIRTIRPAWDQLATMNALEQLLQHRDLADVAYGAIRTAQDPEARTPRALAFTDRDHWQRTRVTPRSPRQDETCTKPGHSGWAANCPQCRADRLAEGTAA